MKLSGLLHHKNLLWTSIIVMFLVSATMVTMVNVTSASPDTYFYVDPPEVSFPGGNFTISINITDAPPSYAWEIYLSWNPDLLELINVTEGDFLHRWEYDPFNLTAPPSPKYSTAFGYTAPDEANPAGEVLVNCVLTGELPMSEWANGNGTLASLEFLVQDAGNGVLNLTNTRLWDHLEWNPDQGKYYPAPTYYDNVDGFVETLSFYNVDVSKWKIKVNGKVEGKTTIGTENLLEAVVNNTGNFDVYVQVLFEIRDVTGYWVASNESDIVFLSAGELTTLSINWTEDDPGVYYITAYAFYSALPLVSNVTIPDGFTNGTITVTEHDIAITNVTCFPTTVTIGDLVSINVTVVNEGVFNETFDVITYYDAVPIETQTGITLDAGAKTTLPFEWNTTFVSADIYNITAEASEVPKEDYPADNTFTFDGNVTVQRLTGWPVANFTYSPEKPFLVDGEVEVTFNSTSYDEDGYIVSWNWDFNGDDFIDVTTENATWIYTGAGNFVVRLIVDDNDTLTPPQGIEKVISVYAPPVANFTYSPEDPMSDETVTFNARDSYDPDGSIVSYFWDFGDGTNATEIDPVTTHKYADDGTYTVTLNITDNDGLSNITSAYITVLNRPPVAIFTESAETVNTGETITFNASDSDDPDGSIVSYFWDFGDGTNATGVIVTHVYVDDGVYTVTLTVTDDDEAQNTATSTKTVLNRPPVAIFTESAETVDTGVVIHFNASESYDPDGSIVSYFWDFGDGTNATGVTVDHAYVEDGNFTVTLTVTDDDEASSSVSATKTVKAPAGWSLAWYAAIGLTIAALTLAAIYAQYRRRKKPSLTKV